MSEPRRYECNICFDTFDQTDKRPRLLHSCLHSFCTECLERLLAKEGKKQITCPLCRRVQKITGSVQALPIDPVRNKLVDYIQLKKKRTTPCTECPNDSAVSRCQECQSYLCKDCDYVHKRHKSTKDHVIISLEEVLEQPIKSLSAGHMCPKHPIHHLEFYCTTDDELCCVSCTVLNHKGHDHVGLEDAHANKGKEVEALLNDGRLKADRIRAAKQQFTKHQRQIVDTKSKSKDDIAAMFCVLRKALDQRERSLVASLDDKANQLMSSIKKTTDAFDDTLAVIESTETYYTEARDKADVVEMLKLYPTFTRSLQGIEAPQSPGNLEVEMSSVTFLRTGGTEAETTFRSLGEFDTGPSQYENRPSRYPDATFRYSHHPHGYPDQTQSRTGYPQQSSNLYQVYHINPSYPSTSHGPNGDPNQFNARGHSKKTFQRQANSQRNYPDSAQHSSAQQFPSQSVSIQTPVQQNPIHGQLPLAPPPGFNTSPDVLWITDPVTKKTVAINAGDLNQRSNMPSPGKNPQERVFKNRLYQRKQGFQSGRVLGEKGQETGDLNRPGSSQHSARSDPRACLQLDDGARAMFNEASFTGHI